MAEWSHSGRERRGRADRSGATLPPATRRDETKRHVHRRAEQTEDRGEEIKACQNGLNPSAIPLLFFPLDMCVHAHSRGRPREQSKSDREHLRPLRPAAAAAAAAQTREGGASERTHSSCTHANSLIRSVHSRDWHCHVRDAGSSRSEPVRALATSHRRMHAMATDGGTRTRVRTRPPTLFALVFVTGSATARIRSASSESAQRRLPRRHTARGERRRRQQRGGE